MKELIDLILEYTDPDGEITAESRLRGDCGLSSFDMMCLTDAINDRYGIKLGFEDMRKCITVGDLAETVNGNTK